VHREGLRFEKIGMGCLRGGAGANNREERGVPRKKDRGREKVGGEKKRGERIRLESVVDRGVTFGKVGCVINDL